MKIISITDVIQPRYRQLTVVSVNNETFIDVLYEVTSDKMDVRSATATIGSAVTAGEFTNSLNSNLAAAGIEDIQAAASVSPLVIDVSPTSAPTYRPSPAPIVGTSAPTHLPTLELTQVKKGVQSCPVPCLSQYPSNSNSSYRLTESCAMFHCAPSCPVLSDYDTV